MSGSDVLQKCVTVVVRPQEQRPDIEEKYWGVVRPRVLGITYSWTAPELRGGEGDMHGEVEVRVQGERIKDGKAQRGGEVILRWDTRESWPLWVKEITGQYTPEW